MTGGVTSCLLFDILDDEVEWDRLDGFSPFAPFDVPLPVPLELLVAANGLNPLGGTGIMAD